MAGVKLAISIVGEQAWRIPFCSRVHVCSPTFDFIQFLAEREMGPPHRNRVWFHIRSKFSEFQIVSALRESPRAITPVHRSIFLRFPFPF